MNIKVTDHSDLYYSAQVLVNNVLNKMRKDHTTPDTIQYRINDLKHMLNDQAASSSVHLEAIAHLMQTYTIRGQEQTQPLPIVDHFSINGQDHVITIQINPQVKNLIKGQYEINTTY